MTEELIFKNNATKEERYLELLPQIRALVLGETDYIANLANIVGALKQAFSFFWVGVYLVKGNQLVLGPFQGPIACTRIPFGKGVCGSAWAEKRLLRIDDVAQFPEHISCNALSKSEIVLPVFNAKGEVDLVLDIDSALLSDFDNTDEKYLSEVALLIAQLEKNESLSY
jgi:L-methionine (R)-S-oxide reductase